MVAMAKTREPPSSQRRSLLTYATGTLVFAGAALSSWPLIVSMAPDKATPEPFEVNFSELKEGQVKTFKWKSIPYIIAYLTKADITTARLMDITNIPDIYARNSALPNNALATYENRSFGPEHQYVLMSELCTRLECMVKDRFWLKQEFSRYACPCCGAHFDSVGRVLSPPATTNLPIPRFRMVAEQTLQLGTDVGVG
jgi:ubiquinol-cytochrome c reductase iron-sulfur subunit